MPLAGATSSAGPPLPVNPQMATCLSSTRVDFDYQDPCYVFKAVCSPDGLTLAASVSSNKIKIYNFHNASPVHAGDLHAHGATITDICFPFADCPSATYSSSRDGTVKGWDLRSGAEVESYQAPQQEVSSFSVLNHLVAVGGHGNVLFFDRRTRKRLGCFEDTHLEDVTQVADL